LKEAKLVVDRALGTRRLYQLNPEALNRSANIWNSSGTGIERFRRKIEETTTEENDEHAANSVNDVPVGGASR